VDQSSERLLLIFDGRCGVCTRSIRMLGALDRGRRVLAIPCQRPGAAESVGLTPEDCESAAWAVAPDGRLYRGAEAMNVALSAALRTRLPHVLYELPVIGRWQDRVYRWVAANRRRLPGDVAHCSQHPEDCP
jgi:predicted DCC family thiol-disulfide oxidoreductase YuxK